MNRVWLVMVCVAAAAVAGCGGGSGSAAGGVGSVTGSRASFELAALRPVARPGPVVVRVGGGVITKGEVDLATGEPRYKTCVTAHKASEPAGDRHHTRVELEVLCRHLYVERKLLALSSMISTKWILGEAAELGITPDGGEVKRILEREMRLAYPHPGELQKHLEAEDRTLADLATKVEVSLAIQRIRTKAENSAGSVTPAVVAGYYNTHLDKFKTPETRDIEAIRTWTKGAILKARKEVLAGKNFAAIAKHVSIDQPSNEHGGVTLGVILGQEEPGYDEAIFTARPHVLVGPLHLRERYYIFEVTKIHPSHQHSLQAVKAEIQRTLPEELKQQALTRFIGSWRNKWRARTTCQPDYIIAKCREYQPKQGPHNEPTEEDPHTLN